MTTQRSANNVYWVPIKAVSFLECLDEPPAVGHRETKCLSEGRDAEFARSNLRDYPGCGENWNKLTPEQKQRIQPFLLDYDREVKKVPECQRRFKNRYGDYTCGLAVHDVEGHEDKDDESVNMNGEFGMCVIEGYDTPNFEDCPFNKKLVGLGIRK